MVMTRSDFQNYMTTFFNFIIYTNSNMVGMLEASLTNDKTAGDAFRLSLLRRNALIESYLTAWDAAPTDPDKEVVESSVIFDLGSASLNPDDAVLWPESGGLFGNVIATGSVSDNATTAFDGTSGHLIKEQV